MKREDPDFAHDCLRATIYNVATHYEEKASQLREALEALPSCLRDSVSEELPGTISIPWYQILEPIER